MDTELVAAGLFFLLKVPKLVFSYKLYACKLVKLPAVPCCYVSVVICYSLWASPGCQPVKTVSYFQLLSDGPDCFMSAVSNAVSASAGCQLFETQ
jgi:hypothetical protein